MKYDLNKIIGRYPVLYDREKEFENEYGCWHRPGTIIEKVVDTPECKERIVKFNMEFDKKWARVYEAAELVRRTLDDDSIIRDLDSEKEEEKEAAELKILGSARVDYTKRKLEEILEVVKGQKPILTVRKIEYYQEKVRRSLGPGEDSWTEVVEYSTFTDSVDFNLSGDYMRLEIGGDCKVIEKIPQIRINQLFISHIERWKDYSDFEFMRRLKEKPLTYVEDLQDGWNIYGFGIQTQMHVEEFYSGKNLSDLIGRLQISKIEKPQTFNDGIFIPVIKDIIENIEKNSVGMPIYLKPESKLHYEKDPKNKDCGKPLRIDATEEDEIQ